MSDASKTYCGCLYHSIGALGRALTRLAEEEFAPTGLSPSHGFILMSVNKKPGIQPSELSCHMQLTPSTVTRLVEKMEYKGLVKREGQGREVLIYPTESGEKLGPKVKAAWKRLYTRYSSALGEEAAKELTRLSHQAYETLITSKIC